MEQQDLVVHEEQSFLSKVMGIGTEQGLFTRDRADELIRVAVAMANKYVIQKEVDFRSVEELSAVQETILNLIGVGLEIKSKGDVEEAIHILADERPVLLFRLAHTRIEKLRARWRELLKDHRIMVMVTKDEFECLSDLTCSRLASMSIFTDSELHTIESMTLEDKLFSSLGIVEYYEGEVDRYEFILKLKKILPFDLLNKSLNARAENLAEVDSAREALVNTLIISSAVDSEDPITVSMPDIRRFLTVIEQSADVDPFSEELEETVLELIHELAEGLDERDASLLTREMVGIAQKLIETILSEWDMVCSSSELVFYKRWTRMVVLNDAPDPLERVLCSGQMLDEFDLEFLINQLLQNGPKEAGKLIERIPWKLLLPDQTIRLFQDATDYREKMAKHVDLESFTAGDIVDLLEELDSRTVKKLMPALTAALAHTAFTIEELELLASHESPELNTLLRLAGPPAGYDLRRAVADFQSGSLKLRKILFHATFPAEYLADFLQELLNWEPAFLKKELKAMSTSEVIGLFARLSSPGAGPKFDPEGAADPDSESDEISGALLQLAPAAKRRAVTKFFADAAISTCCVAPA